MYEIVHIDGVLERVIVLSHASNVEESSFNYFKTRGWCGFYDTYCIKDNAANRLPILDI